jgi:hypothetical protein
VAITSSSPAGEAKGEAGEAGVTGGVIGGGRALVAAASGLMGAGWEWQPCKISSNAKRIAGIIGFILLELPPGKFSNRGVSGRGRGCQIKEAQLLLGCFNSEGKR